MEINGPSPPRGLITSNEVGEGVDDKHDVLVKTVACPDSTGAPSIKVVGAASSGLIELKEPSQVLVLDV